MSFLGAQSPLAGLEEPRFVRKVSLSLVAMGVLAGAGLRVYRTIVLQYGWSDSWLWISGTLLGGIAFLLLMTTLHLGNYPVTSWIWRAPLFALVESVTEILVSLALTLAGLEVIGSLRATLEDWQSTSVRVLFFRLLGIPLFALVLALVTTVVRIILIPRKHSHLHPHA